MEIRGPGFKSQLRLSFIHCLVVLYFVCCLFICSSVPHFVLFFVVVV